MRAPGCTSRTISIASGRRGSPAAMNPTVTGRLSRCASSRAVSKHSRTARGSFDPAAASRMASRSVRSSASRRSASTSAIRGSGPSSGARPLSPPMRSRPCASPVRTWNPAESTSGTMTAPGAPASPATAAATSVDRASTKLIETSSSGRAVATASTRRMTAARFSGDGEPCVTATRRSGGPTDSLRVAVAASLDPTMHAPALRR